MNKNFKSTDHLRAYKSTMSQLGFMKIDAENSGPINLIEST